MDIDLDVLGEKSTDTVTLFGKARPIARLKTKEHVKMMDLFGEYNGIGRLDEKAMDEVENKVRKCFMSFIPDLTKDEYEQMNYNQKLAVFQYLDDLFMLDQGVPEEKLREVKAQMEANKMDAMVMQLKRRMEEGLDLPEEPKQKKKKSRQK